MFAISWSIIKFSSLYMEREWSKAESFLSNWASTPLPCGGSNMKLDVVSPSPTCFHGSTATSLGLDLPTGLPLLPLPLPLSNPLVEGLSIGDLDLGWSWTWSWSVSIVALSSRSRSGEESLDLKSDSDNLTSLSSLSRSGPKLSSSMSKTSANNFTTSSVVIVRLSRSKLTKRRIW